MRLHSIQIVYKIVVLLTIFIFSNPIHGQFNINYNWSYGGSHNEAKFWSNVIEVEPHRFISACPKVSDDGMVTDFQGRVDVWLLMHDSGGNIIWQKSFGGTRDEYPTGLMRNQYGEIIVVGFTSSSDGHFNSQDSVGDAFILKTDSVGNLLWVKNLGGSGFDQFNNVVEDSFGNMYIAGHTDSNDGDIPSNNGSEDFWVLKMDSSGTIIWNKSIGGNGSEANSHILLDGDGYLILAGSSSSVDSSFIITKGVTDAVLVKISKDGIVQWSKNYGGTLYDGAATVGNSLFGGYVYCGATNSNDGDLGVGIGSYDSWIVELDTSGTILWNKRYGGSKRDAAFKVLIRNSGYAILGASESHDFDVSGNHSSINSPRVDIWYLELDAGGNLLWERCFGSSQNNDVGDFINLSDGSVLISGSASVADGDVSFVNGTMGFDDLWIVNFSTPVSVQSDIDDLIQPVVYPNPFTEYLKVEFDHEHASVKKHVSIKNIFGQVVFENVYIGGFSNINLSHLPAGTYFLEQYVEGYFPKVSHSVIVKH